MTDHYKLISQIYSEIGITAPEVSEYKSLKELLSNFEQWKHKASPMTANYWEYQYPVLHPESYWCKYHLHQTNFQIDIKRSANKHGCFSIHEQLSEIEINPSHLFNCYVSELNKALRTSVPTKTDSIVQKAINQSESVLDLLYSVLHTEDPTNQGAIEEFIFLGDFEWLRIERQLLEGMREYIGKPVCNEHYENVVALCESNSNKAMHSTIYKLVVLWSLCRSTLPRNNPST